MRVVDGAISKLLTPVLRDRTATALTFPSFLDSISVSARVTTPPRIQSAEGCGHTLTLLWSFHAIVGMHMNTVVGICTHGSSWQSVPATPHMSLAFTCRKSTFCNVNRPTHGEIREGDPRRRKRMISDRSRVAQYIQFTSDLVLDRCISPYETTRMQAKLAHTGILI